MMVSPALINEKGSILLVLACLVKLENVYTYIFFKHINLMLQRIFSFLLIGIAHLVLLQLLLYFINRVSFSQIQPIEIVPITILLDKAPIVTKVASAQPTKTVTHKKITPLPPLKTAPIEIVEPSDISTSLPEEAPSPAIVAPSLVALVPPSASYLLDVIRTEPKLSNPYHGAGKIRWQHDDSNYTMQVEAGIDILFTTIRLYSLQSEGTIGYTGIKPYTVTETRRGRETTTTQFNYDSNSISFSADPIIIPLSEGAQDKMTAIMQLASMGNADPEQFQAGKEITIQIAEEKEAHLHQFVMLDQETIDTKLGQLVTWHVVRPPRPGIYSSRIDIWLAPELNWIPVQIRNTEANGAITTQTIRQIIQE